MRKRVQTKSPEPSATHRVTTSGSLQPIGNLQPLQLQHMGVLSPKPIKAAEPKKLKIDKENKSKFIK